MADNATPLDRLAKNLQADNHDALRRARRGVVIQVAMLVLVFAYMTFLYSQIKQVTPDEMVKFGGTMAENELPTLSNEMVSYAVDSAPQAGEAFKQRLLEFPAYVREMLVAMVLDRTRKHMPKFEEDIDRFMTATINEQIRTIQSTSTARTGPETQIQAMLIRIRANYREQMMELSDSLYHQYAREVSQLCAYLTRLGTAGDLTEKERLEKELIQALMVMVEKHDLAVPAVNSNQREFPDLVPSNHK